MTDNVAQPGDVDALVVKMEETLRRFPADAQAHWTYENPDTREHALLRDCLSILKARADELSSALQKEKERIQDLEQERDDWKGRFEAVDRAIGMLQEDYEAAQAQLAASSTENGQP